MSVNVKSFVPFLLIGLLSAISCKKDNSTQPAEKFNADVYAVGLTSSSSRPSIAACWKNGVPVNLATDTTISSGATSIAVNGNDIYVAGYIGFADFISDTSNHKIAAMWKNGIITKLTDGTTDASANAVALNGSDIYLAGEYHNNAIYWKNGVAVKLVDRFLTSVASGIVINGTDVYVCGTSRDSNGASTATYWKNGVPTYFTGYYTSAANGIIAKDNDIYIVGFGNPTPVATAAVYWKNDKAVILSDESTGGGYATSIVVNGSDVYVAGSAFPNNAKVTGYWKNGIMTILNNAIFTDAIAVNGTNVYVGGTGKLGNATYWKNGDLIQLTNNYSTVTGVVIVSN